MPAEGGQPSRRTECRFSGRETPFELDRTDVGDAHAVEVGRVDDLLGHQDLAGSSVPAIRAAMFTVRPK